MIWIALLAVVVCICVGYVFGHIMLHPKPKVSKHETCDYCKHLYFYNDGSPACDSQFEKACLQSSTRMFKEFDNEREMV